MPIQPKKRPEKEVISKELREKLEDEEDVESQFILRLPEGPAASIREVIANGKNLKGRMKLELNDDLRIGTLYLDDYVLPSKVVDLPCILEAHKTEDGNAIWKVGDVTQMVVCSEPLPPQTPDDNPIASSSSNPIASSSNNPIACSSSNPIACSSKSVTGASNYASTSFANKNQGKVIASGSKGAGAAGPTKAKTVFVRGKRIVINEKVPSAKKPEKEKDPYVWPHGLTPPLKNVRKNRFRKTLKNREKKIEELLANEKEVKRLLRADMEAHHIKWEVVIEEEEEPSQEGQDKSMTKKSQGARGGPPPPPPKSKVVLASGTSYAPKYNHPLDKFSTKPIITGESSSSTKASKNGTTKPKKPSKKKAKKNAKKPAAVDSKSDKSRAIVKELFGGDISSDTSSDSDSSSSSDSSSTSSSSGSSSTTSSGSSGSSTTSGSSSSTSSGSSSSSDSSDSDARAGEKKKQAMKKIFVKKSTTTKNATKKN